MEQVSRLYTSVENIIAISIEQDIPTYRAADVLAEQRIVAIRQLKSLASGNERSS
jgi:leucine dehydrogenase